MDSFLSHAAAERRHFCEAAADKLGLQAVSVEKDFTEILRVVGDFERRFNATV